MRRWTLKRLAQDLDVSTMTVSRALRGAGGVGEETAERIRRYANSVNYQPDLVARSLAVKRTHAIGVIIPNLRHSFWHDVIIAIEQHVRSAGYTVVITHSDDDPERERSEIDLLVSRRVDALLVASCARDCNLAALERVDAQGVPVVLFDRYPERFTGPGVFTDDVGGARAVVQHLAGLGRTRIAHLAGDMAYSPARDRLRGYEDAMRELGLQSIVVAAGFGEENGYRAMQRLLNEGNADAVFAVHDYSAIGAMDAALERGLRLPEDIALVGYGATDCAKHVTVPLTTVVQPMELMGECIARQALNRVAGAKNADQRVVLPTSLIVRRSSVDNNVL